MPSKSPAQKRLMEAAAHTPGGYDGVPQSVGKEFVRKDETGPRSEIDVAKDIRDGLVPSGQRLGDMWLFDLRVTGTGVSYRPQHEEYVFRPPEFYLCEDFLERCQGLSVIFDHPEKGLLNTEEFRERAIGSIVLPYIPTIEDEKHRLSDVWGISRVYDGDAAEIMLSTDISTSPAVTFPEGGMQVVRAQDGSRLMIEGKPELLDHLAVVPGGGVWDKGTGAVGVA